MDTYEAKWTAASRKAYHDEYPENFAGPDMSFPIKDASDVNDAWRLSGHADNPDAVRSKIKAIAKRLGISGGLPDTAKEQHTQESNLPKEKIATIQVDFIRDGAASLNNRIYPRETVDKLIFSAQRRLADPNALPITCFLSHEDADGDKTRALVGKVTNVWRDGERGVATIDLADTSVAKDVLGLIVGGYLRTESLRASGAEIKAERGYDAPLVVGNPELDGIDFTNYPGLAQDARIQHVTIAESLDSFSVDGVKVVDYMNISQLKVSESPGGNMPVYTPATGNTVGMTSGSPDDTYHQAMYKEPTVTSGPMQGMTQVPELMEAHDRIAMVQGRSCAPGKESVRWALAYMSLNDEDKQVIREKGRKLSALHDSHLDKAHDAIAKHQQMSCEGAQNKMGSAKDPDNDGDDDTTNDPKKNPDFGLDNMEKQAMTKEEALQLLESEGFDVSLQKKKTEAEKLDEKLEAIRAEALQKIAEMQKPQDPAPQRRSLVSGASSVSPRSIRNQLYTHGKYLKEQIKKSDWEDLADRTCPLPEGIALENLIKEFEQLYAFQYDERYQVLSATELR